MRDPGQTVKVHRPSVQLDARGRIATHGKMTPVRGDWHDTECGDAQGIKELEGVVAFWQRQGLGYGAHLIIDKDGNSALCANFDEECWHTENRNGGMIGIELIGYARFTPKLWFLRLAQLNKLAKWIAYARAEHGIPIDFNVNKGWSGHVDQSKAFGGTHYDPGAGFPRRYVLRKARIYYQKGWS